VWDIASLEMLTYVKPERLYFNANSPVTSVPDGNVHVQFNPQGVIGYSVSGNKLTLRDDDPVPELMAALVESAKKIVGNPLGMIFRRESTRFSHGLVHAEFWEEIGHTNNVDAIEISDGFFFPRTSAGLPVAVVSVQLQDVRLDTEPGHEEIYITIEAAHIFRNESIPPSFSWDYPKIGNRGSTRWQTVGVFPLDWDCLQLESVIIMLSIKEEDDLSFDDNFSTEPQAFQTGALDCSGMQAAFDNGEFGIYEQLPDEQLIIVDNDDNVEGALTARIKIFIFKQ
jgi:hypothetical protein